MSEFYIENGELKHYGVVGMRWGVRRASKRLSKSTTREDRDKAISSLNKHRAKGSAKIEKLNKKGAKLAKAVDRKIIKNDTEAARLNQQAAYNRNKAYGRFTTQRRSSKLIFKANKLQAQADKLAADSQRAKAKMEANKTMIKAFETEIRNIDAALVDAGKKYLGA